jgi:hypothetical protein
MNTKRKEKMSTERKKRDELLEDGKEMSSKRKGKI